MDSFTFLKYANSSLNDVLQQELAISNQQYGLTLSQISFRGMSSNNTLIYAGGIPLTFPSLGTTDLTLIPINLFNDAHILNGGTGTQVQSGGNGAHILLNNSEVKTGRPMLSTSVGSFGAYHYLAKIPFSINKNSFSISLYRNFAVNNYPYQDRFSPDRNRKELDNSYRNSNGVFIESNHQIDSHWTVKNMIWGIYAQSGIPTPIHLPLKMESKVDSSLRVSTRLNYDHKRINFHNTFAYTSEGQTYFNPSIQLISSILCKKIFINSEFSYNLSKKSDFVLSAQHITTQGKTNNYVGTKLLHQSSLFGKLSHSFDSSLSADIYSREELLNRKLQTPSFGFEIEKKLIEDKWSIVLNGNRNYLLPTLNDLYWFPGGNVNLKPEIDYQLNLDNNLQYLINKDDIIKVNVSAFYYIIENKIVWLNSGLGYFSPQNIGKVNSYGVQASISYTKILGKVCVQAKVKYQYNPVLNKTEIGSLEFNKQLMYMPLHNLTSSLDVYGDRFMFGINYLFNSQRFYSTDNYDAVPNFYLFNFYGNYILKVKKRTIEINAKVKNILSAQYEQVVFYPMPLINFEAGLKITL